MSENVRTFASDMRELPPITWLRVTDYMHGWIQQELTGELKIQEQRVVCVEHLKGAHEVLRMETVEAPVERPVGKSISSTFRNCIDAGLDIDEDAMRETYGVTREDLKLYLPIECPPKCLTRNGVLRRWTGDTRFGRQQTSAMQQLLRDTFWEAVERFDRAYAQKMGSKDYPAVDMIEAFCAETKTPDIYVDAMRREWQRRQKRHS